VPNGYTTPDQYDDRKHAGRRAPDARLAYGRRQWSAMPAQRPSLTCVVSGLEGQRATKLISKE
jgi:hypothetical protein